MDEKQWNTPEYREDHRLTAFVDKETKDRITAMSREQGRSISNMIGYLLRLQLSESERED